MHSNIKDVFLTFIGGACGALCRYCLDFSGCFLLGLSLGNCLGCFLLGSFCALTLKRKIVNYWFIPLVQTGFLGGFTSFSAVILLTELQGLSLGMTLVSILKLLFVAFLSFMLGLGIIYGVIKLIYFNKKDHLIRSEL